MENRLRLYRRVRGFCRAAQWLLLAAMVAWVVFYVVTLQHIGRLRGRASSHAYLTLHQTLRDYAADVRRDLVLFPPPADTRDSLEMVAWRDNLRFTAGDHAAIFLRTDNHTDWLQKPAALTEAAAWLEAQWTDSVPRRTELRTRDMAVERVYVPPEPENYYDNTVAEIAGPLKEIRRWGVLYRPRDLWYPVAARLRDAPPTPVDGPPDPLAERVEAVLKVTPSAFTKTPFRIFMDGELLFASPGLDTTRPGYPDSIWGAALETYLSPWDDTRAFSGLTLLAGLLFLALLFFIFQRIYRWAGKLMKGEPAPARVDVIA